MTTELKPAAEHWPVSNEDYHLDARNSLSHSEAEVFTQSPELYWGRYLTGIYPREETDDLRFGSLFHSYVLEGVKPAIAPKCDRRTAAGKRDYAAFLTENQGKEVVTAEEWDLLCNMRSGIDRNKAARLLLSRQRETEFSIRWTDVETGLRLRCRLDMFADICADLKSTRDASAKGFASAAYRLGYARQQAWYGDGVSELTSDSRRFAFIAVQKTPPYTCNVFELDDDFVAMGRAENREILKRFAESKKTSRWGNPSAEIIVKLSAPRWARYGDEYDLQK